MIDNEKLPRPGVEARATALGTRLAERFDALHNASTLEEAKRHGLALHALANQAAVLASEVLNVGVQPLTGGIDKP